MRRFTLLVASLLLAPAARAQGGPATPPPADSCPPPAVPREFRGVWVASVSNLDWPSRPDLTTAEQQTELLAILDRAAALNLNAVILQVRPSSDALYRPGLEPWSAYLTGKMGRAPHPFYDPLAFAVKEAHARGLELHAWFNPFRALDPSAIGRASPGHVTRATPKLVRHYGSSVWLDPGEPAVRRHVLRVILDVVRRYDIDGVHLDDYFYPYIERDARGRAIPFPDDVSWRRYRRAGGRMTRADWRRHNVNLFVEELYHEVKGEKPWVKVGISPFGIWRPGAPPGVDGLDPYTELYADSREWLRRGWLDYLAPQLYWPMDAPRQSFTALLSWWTGENRHHRHIWPGLYTAGVMADGAGWPAGEIVNQIDAIRTQDGAPGEIHFSASALLEDRGGVDEALSSGPYDSPALVPASPWLGRSHPGALHPTVRRDSAGISLVVTVHPAAGSRLWLWTLRARYGDAWETAIVPGASRARTLVPRDGGLPDEVVVSGVGRTGVEGPRTTLGRPASDWRVRAP